MADYNAFGNASLLVRGKWRYKLRTNYHQLRECEKAFHMIWLKNVAEFP